MWVWGFPCPEQLRTPLLGFLALRPTEPLESTQPRTRTRLPPSPGPVSFLQGKEVLNPEKAFSQQPALI